MSATMTTMFVMLTQTVSTPSAPTTASVKKVYIGDGQSCQGTLEKPLRRQAFIITVVPATRPMF